MYDILLFDLDGTLTNSKEGITKSVQFALKHYGIYVDDLEQLTCFIGPPLVDEFQEYCGFSREKALEVREKFRERYDTIGLWENELYPGTTDMLEALKNAGKRLAVATSKPETTAKRILEKFGVLDYFETVSGSDMEQGRSTKSQVIEEALIRMNCEQEEVPEAEMEAKAETEAEVEIGTEVKTGQKRWKTNNILMIGDRKHDVEGAAAFHMDCVGVKYGFAPEGELEQAGALFVVESAEELKNKLLIL